MLKGEWARFICMASETHLVLGGGGAQLMSIEPTVRIMAIAAGNQALIHLVVKRLGEISFHFQVASEAERRLRRLQELMLNFWSVGRVAIQAADVVLQVLRAQEVAVLFAEFVAAQTALG